MVKCSIKMSKNDTRKHTKQKSNITFNKQHIGFMFKKHWKVQGKRIPIKTGAEEYLNSKGIPVQDALEFVKEPSDQQRLQIVGFYDPPLPLDENHPQYKERPCYTLGVNNVLLEGINQAQILTKTVIAHDKLPPRVEELAQLSAPKAIHENVKKAILSANVFDCEQKKLPKVVDPVRPAHILPRLYGITDRRRTEILSNRLLQIIEKSSDTESTISKYVINNAEINILLEKDQELLQFNTLSNILITSNKPLNHEVGSDVSVSDIPDLYPVKHTITMPLEHFYKDSQFSIGQAMKLKHPHTTWLNFNHTEVGNIYEEPVTHEQQLGRSLTHTFAVAAAYAKQVHGDNVKDLPEPVFVNCIQSDGKIYHFGVLQLNTLNLDGIDGKTNVWYCKNNMVMYDSSKYFNGMPVLENYNPQVYCYINAFYHC